MKNTDSDRRRQFVRNIAFSGVLAFSFVAGTVTFISQSASACPCDKYKDVSNKTTTTETYTNKRGLEFMKPAAYHKEFKDAVASGRKACEDYLKKHPGENDMAIVSDIDETLLDNSDYYRVNDEFKWPEFLKYAGLSKTPALKPSADFLNWARKKGFAIFLVTGRPEDMKAATIKNLVRCGITYDTIYFRPDNDERPASQVKSAVRKKIEDMGFKIVVNIGDQTSDLAGGYSIDCEKLPNKFYELD